MADPTDILDDPAAGAAVVRGGASRTIAYVVGTVLALVAVALLTRHLGVERYGRFQVVLSLITVIGTLTDAGMGTLGMREYAQRSGTDRERFMRELLGLRLALTALGVALAVGVAALSMPGELVLGTLAAGGGLALTVLATTLSIPLAATLRNDALGGLEVLRQGLTVAFYVVLIALGAGTAAFLATPIPIGVVVVAITAVLVRRGISLRPAVAPRAWAGMLRGAVAFTLATAVGTIYIYTAQLLCAIVSNETQTGLFSVSFRVTVTVAAVPGLLATVAFPLLARAARDDRTRLTYALQRLFEANVVLGIGAGLTLALGAPFVVRVIADASFADAAAPLRIQAVAICASFVLAAFTFALLSLHRHRELLIANLAAFAVSLIAVGVLASARGAPRRAPRSARSSWPAACSSASSATTRRCAPSWPPRARRCWSRCPGWRCCSCRGCRASRPRRSAGWATSSGSCSSERCPTRSGCSCAAARANTAQPPRPHRSLPSSSARDLRS